MLKMRSLCQVELMRLPFLVVLLVAPLLVAPHVQARRICSDVLMLMLMLMLLLHLINVFTCDNCHHFTITKTFTHTAASKQFNGCVAASY
jgi:hypothetical protein